jgi:hypothetical protein
MFGWGAGLCFMLPFVASQAVLSDIDREAGTTHILFPYARCKSCDVELIQFQPNPRRGHCLRFARSTCQHTSLTTHRPWSIHLRQ